LKFTCRLWFWWLKLLYKLNHFHQWRQAEFYWENKRVLSHLSESDSPKFLSDSRIHEFNQRSFIPLCVSTLRLIFHSWKCDVYQFPFHLPLCFHFLVLNNFSNFLLDSIPTIRDQSNESNPVDPHHLLFHSLLSRFGIGKEVYYTKCLTEGHPCLVAFDYGSENNVVSHRLVEKLQLPSTFHLDQTVHGNVWKKYYVILLPWTLVIFFWDGHGFVLKHSILMNVPFIWGMRDIKWSIHLWHQDKSVRINVGWRRKLKKKE